MTQVSNVAPGPLVLKSSPEPAKLIQSNLIKIILGCRKFKFVQLKGQVLFKGEIITKM
jgi:hypothetical protein